MINRNDKPLGLFNGDVGLMVKMGTGYKTVFARYGQFELFEYSHLPVHQLAFAMTVHKSQGSEYDNVLLVLPDHRSQLMTREILYTGLTRAKSYVGIYGSRVMLDECIRGKVRRSGGLGARLGWV